MTHPNELLKEGPSTVKVLSTNLKSEGSSKAMWHH